jgi:hypothetical protein
MLKIVTPKTCKIGPKHRIKKIIAESAQNLISLVFIFKIAMMDKNNTVYPANTVDSTPPPIK